MKLENVQDIYPLTPMQEGMLYHCIAQPDAGAYVDQVIVTLEGSLDLERFVGAFRRVAARFDTLRTAFLWDGVDKPLQIVRDQVEYEVAIVDGRPGDAEARRRQLDELVTTHRVRGFVLEEAPLLRLTLLRQGPAHTDLLLCFHHLILDGWSARTLLQRALREYDGLPSRQPEYRYRDYVEWILGQDQEAARRFWREQLHGFGAQNRLTSGTSVSSDSAPHQQRSVRIPPAQSARLREMARNHSLTLNTALLAAWSLVLNRYSGGDRDVVFGATVAGRDPRLVGIEQAVGSFINTLPFRAQIDPCVPLVDWCRQLQATQSAQRDWEFTSLAEAQKCADVPAGESLFESLFVFENYPAGNQQLGSVQATRYEHHEYSNYPLALIVVPSDQLECLLVYDPESFSSSIIERMLGHLAWLIEQFAAQPDARVEQLLRLPPIQCEQLATLGHAESLSTNPELEHLSMTEWLSETASAHADDIAVRAQGHSLTYRELDRRASDLAGRLLTLDLGPQRRIGICCDRSAEMVVAIVAAFKAGAAYVPLDTLYPEHHFRHVIKDADLRVVMTTRCHQECLPQEGQRTVLIDETTAIATTEAIAFPRPALDDEAYVIYTSGSTGTPKGVSITHRNLVHSTAARRTYYDQSPRRFLLLSSFAFDSSVAGIFWTLCSGGTLVLPASGEERDMHRVLQLLREEKVTHLLALPTLYQILLESAAAGDLATLSVAIVAGEQVKQELPAQHRARVPSAQLHNEYGPTEGTVWATASRVDTADANQSISIGHPIASMGIMVLGPGQRPVPLGTAGELYLHGPAVSSGYLNREELTRERFPSVDDHARHKQRMYRTGDRVVQRDSGELVFLGRCDRQVKVRGYRVELGQVEAALRSLPAIRDAVAQPHEINGRVTGLVAYLVTDEIWTKDRLVTALDGRLPDFMLPSSIVQLPVLPRLPNGKLDVDALPAPAAEVADRREFISPRSRVETELAHIWASVLGLEQVGIHDNYFELGGDSIASIQVISRARRQGIQIQPRQLAQCPTIAALAAVAHHDLDAGQGEVTTGPVPLSPIQSWFFEMEHPNPHHWNHSMLFELRPGYDPDVLTKALGSVLQQYPSLHTRFSQDEAGNWRAEVVEPASSLLVSVFGYQPSDVEAFEQKCLEVQTQLNLEHGPLFRAARFVNEQGGPDRLLLAVHHLGIDAVAWRILSDELEYAYAAIHRQREDQPTADHTEYLGWLASQETEAHHDQRVAELDFWVDQLSSDWPTDPSPATPIVESDIDVVHCELDAATTAALRFDANDAYHTRVSDLLVAALAMAISDWSGGVPEARLMLEGHGRGTEEDEGDLARGVGWFTCTYPVRVVLKPGELQTNLRLVKETLRSIPAGGVGFGQLRYTNAQTADVLRQYPLPPVLFNFMGTIPPRSHGSLLSPESQVHETSRDPQGRRAHPIEINAVIEDGVLRMQLAFATDHMARSQAQVLADAFVHQAMQIADHCVRAGSSFTPSDFPEAELSQSELDEFLEGFE